MMPVAMAHDTGLEHSSLGDLYVEHAPDGIRLAFLLTGDRSLAEDLVQEAFARLVGRHRKVERAYLERVARAPQPRSNPNEELDETMHDALLRLPERQRAALVLRFYEDLSDVQTAEILRCSAGTVRSLVSRGMATLREELEGVAR
jgi:DNA-directed RNA polymerase specialized sigma24 family protein